MDCTPNSAKLGSLLFQTVLIINLCYLKNFLFKAKNMFRRNQKYVSENLLYEEKKLRKSSGIPGISENFGMKRFIVTYIGIIKGETSKFINQ